MSAPGPAPSAPGPAAEGLGAWPPPGTLPADPPVAWPASAPADAFGSWSPASAPPNPGAEGGPASGPPAPSWPSAGTPAPGLPAPDWSPAGAPAPGLPAPDWPASGAPASGPPAPSWPAAGTPVEAGDLAAQNWPGAGPGLGQTPVPWVTSAPPQPPWVPAAPPAGEPPRSRPIWIFPAIVAVVLLLAGGTVAFVLRDRWLPGGGGEASPTTGPTSTANPVAPTATRTAAPTTAAPPTAAPTSAGPTLPASVGAVRLDPSLDPAQAPAVAATFDKYFAAVNARNASAALAVMDPNGSINQGDAGAVKRFTDGISTSTDDDILLLSLGSDPTGKGLLQAHVTFRSQQQAGKGPKGRESETCTRWDVTYSITQPGGEYRIWGSTNAGNRPC
ncbi:hypothetical protein ABT369_01000 [Dactylosporangium sp. NPDC000244]|uniref:hypothetical protein n=1 Tax=Dactylosporangium sp. NPDC000244 TaxID=3154365 RepID=UPI003323A8DD